MELYGESYHRFYDLAEGTIGVMADIHADGDTLILENLVIYPVGVDELLIGVSKVLHIRRLIADDARQLGFEKIRITGVRLTGAAPGRAVDVRRRL